MTYRLDIQGLRAVAVISVLIFHFNLSWLPGGFIGVDIFFVISGFLITSIILNKKEKGSFKLIDFYQSRLKRIAPAYYFAIIFTVFAGFFIYTYNDALRSRLDILWSLAFLSNVYFTKLDTYFGLSNSENPLLHTWTLGIEMQFYCLLPLLLLCIKKKYLKLILVLLILFFTAYAQYKIYNGQKNIMYFSLIPRSSEFLLGALATQISIKIKRVNILSALSLVILILCLIFINENSAFPGVLALIPCLATGVVVLTKDSKVNSKFLSHPIMVYIGELSYSIYLWHWIVLAFLRYWVMEYELTLFQNIFAFAIICILSFISYRLIEKPIRSFSNRRAIAIISIFAFLVLGGVFAFKPILSKYNKYPIAYTTPNFNMSTHGQQYIKDVLTGSKNSNDTLLLLGDSHALFLYPYMDSIGKRANLVVRKVTNNTNPSLPGLEASITDKTEKDVYLKMSKLAQKYITTAKYIIYAQQQKSFLPGFNSALDNVLKTLTKSQKFIFLSDIPELKYNPIRANKGIIKRVNISYTQYYPPRPILEIINSYNNSKFVDLTSIKSSQGFPYWNDTTMYYDRGHFNILGSRLYYEKTGDILLKEIN